MIELFSSADPGRKRRREPRSEIFDLEIGPNHHHAPRRPFRAELRASPVGTVGASIRFARLFAGEELARLGMFSGAGRSLRPTAEEPEPSRAERMREAGRKLFEAVFAGKIGIAFRRSLERAQSQDGVLCLRLRIAADSELVSWPWELLYDPETGGFLALSHLTPIVRLPAVPGGAARLAAAPPLRVLGLLANPATLARLAAEAEWQRIVEATSGLVASGKMMLERLPDGRFETLRARLDASPVQVLHFIGHGEAQGPDGEAALCFEGEDGQPAWIGSEALGNLLGESAEAARERALGVSRAESVRLRLVVLNACATGAIPSPRLLDGIVQLLVRRGVPAVLGMRSPVSDPAAVTFAQAFYRGLAGGMVLEGALVEARQALHRPEFGSEWATPVLYTHSPNGQLIARTSHRRAWTIGGLAGAAILTLLALSLRSAPASSRSLPSSDPECPSPPGVELHLRRVPGQPFCLGATEVTVGQWRAVMKSGVTPRRAADLPMTSVSWNEAQAFVDRLDRRVGQPVFRLPAAAEWHLAAAAGSTGDYGFGSDVGELHRYANCENQDHADGFTRVAPVASFAPNPWGFYDFHGNVWEWVADLAPDGIKRVKRGGSFENLPASCRTVAEGVMAPDKSAPSLGFRIARDVQ